MDIHADRLLILDFGSQYTQLIARRVREHGVYSEILPCDVAPTRIAEFAPRGIVLSGGPESTTDSGGWRIPKEVYDLNVPILGICYGMQALAQELGGRVESSDLREFGHADLVIENDESLLEGLSDNGSLSVWMSHGDRVTELPPGFAVIGSSAHAPIAAMANEERRIYGLQFHPEVTHTEGGSEILAKFAHTICGCGREWTPENIIDDAIRQVHEQVGEAGGHGRQRARPVVLELGSIEGELLEVARGVTEDDGVLVLGDENARDHLTVVLHHDALKALRDGLRRLEDRLDEVSAGSIL